LGRALLILGVVNGGLGFQLAGIGSSGVPRSWVIAYAVVSGIMGLVYILVTILSRVFRKARRSLTRMITLRGRNRNGD
jgi:hypothetical protein